MPHRTSRRLPLLPLALGALLLGAAHAQDPATEVSLCKEGSRPLAFAAADLNGDGATDLVAGCGPEDLAASAGPGHVDVLLGTPDGGFERRAARSFERGVAGVALADLTDDGLPDLVANVAGPHERTLVVAAGDGAGGFGEGVATVTEFTLSRAAVVDVDGDGLDDVAMPGENAYFRDGGSATEPGPFARTRLAGMDERRDVHLADVDADGRRDVAHVLPRAGKVRLFASADGTPAEALLGKAVREVRRVLAGGDLNGDGAIDLVLTSPVDPYTSEVRLALSSGDGGDARLGDPLPSLGDPASLLVGDATGDGVLDLVAVPGADPDADGYALRVAAGRGDGTFAEAFEVPLEGFPYRVLLADATGDGVPDALQRDMDASVVRVLPGPLGAAD